MRIIALSLIAVVITLMGVQVSAAPHKVGEKGYTCTINNGYVKADGRGPTAIAAQEAAMLACGDKMIDLQFSRSSDFSEERKDDLALACINLSCE